MNKKYLRAIENNIFSIARKVYYDIHLKNNCCDSFDILSDEINEDKVRFASIKIKGYGIFMSSHRYIRIFIHDSKIKIKTYNLFDIDINLIDYDEEKLSILIRDKIFETLGFLSG